MMPNTYKKPDTESDRMYPKSDTGSNMNDVIDGLNKIVLSDLSKLLTTRKNSKQE